MKYVSLILSLQFLLAATAVAQTDSGELKDGDRVVLLGSTFLERAERYGYLETELTR